MMRYCTFLLVMSFCVFANNPEQIFTSIYETNFWKDTESVSGPGSNLQAAHVIREQLPFLLRKFEVVSILDAPCGDFNWMRTIDLQGYYYIGVDIVDELINNNNKKYATDTLTFKKLNVIIDPLPTVDLIICRDLLVHFPLQEIFQTLANFKRSGSKYLLINTYTDPRRVNKDIPMGAWRPLNFQKEPFNFPEPILLISEEYKHTDRYLALWKIEDI